MNRRLVAASALLPIVIAPFVARAVPIGNCPGLKKLIDTADAIVVLRIDRHLSSFHSPTFYSTHECYVYQTLKGDIPKNARINLRLMNTEASFATPYSHGSTHLMFLMRKTREDEPTEYRTITFKGAQTLLSPLGHEKTPEGKTVEEKVKRLIKDAIVYQAKEHEKRQTFLKSMLGEEDASEPSAAAERPIAGAAPARYDNPLTPDRSGSRTPNSVTRPPRTPPNRGTILKDANADAPSPAVLQEMHDLLAERTRLAVRKRYFERRIKSEPSRREAATSQLQQIDKRIAEIEERLEIIHGNELGKFELVATDAVLDCSEEPRFGQPSYGIISYANASRDIRADELLLFHAGGVYRSKGPFLRLTTTGVGWYFRPSKNIREGDRFVVACIQDAPEEIQNVKNGYMPNSDRARDPDRPYKTNIFIRD